LALHRVDSSVDANVSEKHPFEIGDASSALKMKTISFSEALASIDQSTRRQNTEEQHHQQINSYNWDLNFLTPLRKLMNKTFLNYSSLI
jgi:hypothetical protein